MFFVLVFFPIFLALTPNLSPESWKSPGHVHDVQSSEPETSPAPAPARAPGGRPGPAPREAALTACAPSRLGQAQTPRLRAGHSPESARRQQRALSRPPQAGPARVEPARSPPTARREPASPGGEVPAGVPVPRGPLDAVSPGADASPRRPPAGGHLPAAAPPPAAPTAQALAKTRQEAAGCPQAGVPREGDVESR